MEPGNAQNKRKGKWTKEEDQLLKDAIQCEGEGRWRDISILVPGRSSTQCLHRWTKALRPGIIKGCWTPSEDQQLQVWVQNYGSRKWSQCAALITGRTGKQCRERWINALSPGVKKGDWDESEDRTLLHEFERLGAKWSEIAKSLPGRTDNSIKNRFYANVRKLRPKDIFNPVKGNSFYYDEQADPARIDAEMQVYALLRHMHSLEAVLRKTRREIGVLEESIDGEGLKKDQ